MGNIGKKKRFFSSYFFLSRLEQFRIQSYIINFGDCHLQLSLLKGLHELQNVDSVARGVAIKATTFE